MESRAEGERRAVSGLHRLEVTSREQLAKERCLKCQAILKDYPHLTSFATNAGHIIIEATEYNSCDHCGVEMPMGIAVCPECGKDPNSG